MCIFVFVRKLTWSIKLKVLSASIIKNSFSMSYDADEQLRLAKCRCKQTNIWASTWAKGTYHICERRRMFRAVSPEPSLFTRTIYGIRGSFRQKAKSLTPLSGCACAFKGSRTVWRYSSFDHETAQILIRQLTRLEWRLISNNSFRIVTSTKKI